MPHQLKIQGGTSRSDENLCTGCKWFHSRRHDDNRYENICGYHFYHLIPIHGKVVECNRYVNSNHPSLEDMKKVAWVLRTSSSGKAIGFTNNKEFRAKEGDKDLDELNG